MKIRMIGLSVAGRHLFTGSLNIKTGAVSQPPGIIIFIIPKKCGCVKIPFAFARRRQIRSG